MTQLIRAELLKIRTVNTWWLLALGSVLTTGLALTANFFQAHFALLPFDKYVRDATGGQSPDQLPPQEAARLHEQWAAQHDVVGQAANIFTSGQFFGVVFVAVLAILLITNEYYHQTATATFLTTPHRTTVVLGKLITGMLAAAFFWLFTLVIDVVAGAIFLKTQGYGSQLGEWPVQRAILLNLAAYAVWAVFGIGFGALIRSQIGATVTALVVYLPGYFAASILFLVIRTFMIKHDWVLTAEVIVPARASEIMVSPIKVYPESPAQWVGAAVLIGYGLLAGLIGTAILRRRDIS